MKKLFNLSQDKKDDFSATLFIFGIFANVALFFVISFPNNFNEVLVFNLLIIVAIELFSRDKKDSLSQFLGLSIFRGFICFIMMIVIGSIIYIIVGSLIVIIFGEYGKSFLRMISIYKDEQVWTPFFLILESPFRFLLN